MPVGASQFVRLFPRARQRSATLFPTSQQHTFPSQLSIAHRTSPLTRQASSAAALKEPDDEVEGIRQDDGWQQNQHRVGLREKDSDEEEQEIVEGNNRPEQTTRLGDENSDSSPSSFLETDTTEYDRIVVPRSTHPPGPISVPWPTLFAPRERAEEADDDELPPSDPTDERRPFAYPPSYYKTIRTKPCAQMLSLVRAGSYVEAERLRQELVELGIEVVPNLGYIAMAQWTLEQVRMPLGFRVWHDRTKDGEKAGWVDMGLGVRLLGDEMGPMKLLRLQQLATAQKMAIAYLRFIPTRKVQPRMPVYRLPPYIQLSNVILQNNHHLDYRFLHQVLCVAAEKGVLEGFVRGGIFREWVSKVSAVSVEDSLEGLNDIIQSAIKGSGLLRQKQPDFLEAPEPSSREQRHAERQRHKRLKYLRYQATILRNIHLRTLVNMRDPPVEAVKRIFISRERKGMTWGMATKRGVLMMLKKHSGGTAEEEKVSRRSEEEDKITPAEYLKKALIGKTEDPDKDLPKRVLQVAHRRTDQKASIVAEVIIRLDAHGRHGLIRRIRNRFVTLSPDENTGQPGQLPRLRHPGTHLKNHFTSSFWLMVTMMIFKAEGRPARAIVVFGKNYLWDGLPSLEGVQMVEPVSPFNSLADMSRPKHVPNKHVIAVAASCILDNLDSPTSAIVKSLHEHAILSAGMHDPPIEMDDYSHLPYILALLRVEKSTAVEEYLQSMESRGLTVGVACWTALLTEYTRSRHSRRAGEILNRFTRLRRGRGSRGFKRMYYAVAAMHMRLKQQKRARAVLEKLLSLEVSGERISSALMSKRASAGRKKRRSVRGKPVAGA